VLVEEATATLLLSLLVLLLNAILTVLVEECTGCSNSSSNRGTTTTLAATVCNMKEQHPTFTSPIGWRRRPRRSRLNDPGNIYASMTILHKTNRFHIPTKMTGEIEEILASSGRAVARMHAGRFQASKTLAFLKYGSVCLHMHVTA
jgi:hypothetical protein